MTTIHTHNQRAKRTLKRKSIKTFPTIPTSARTLFNSQADDLIMGKEFSLGDVLSITTGRLLSERHMELTVLLNELLAASWDYQLACDCFLCAREVRNLRGISPKTQSRRQLK